MDSKNKIIKETKSNLCVCVCVCEELRTSFFSHFFLSFSFYDRFISYLFLFNIPLSPSSPPPPLLRLSSPALMLCSVPVLF